MLADPESPYISLNEGYCGDGGIPGYIFAWLVPNQYTLERLPVALAHEVNHNIRFQFIRWRNDITLAEMMVSEGLAENFATYLYGEDKAGPWVTKTDIKTLNEYIKPIIYDGLNVQGLENLNAYLYGDEMAKLQSYPAVGLPYCAGYACGYHLVKHYLKKTGKSIVESTCSSADFLKRLVKWYARRGIRVECVQTDNGFEFTNRFSNSKRDIQTLFEKTAAELGVQHKLIRPYTPRHNGKVERSHREDQKRFYSVHSFFSLADFHKQLAVHNRRSNNLPMRPLQWFSPLEFLVQFV